MDKELLKKIPVLAPGCRVKDEMILIPEGILKLSPGGSNILRYLDGQRTVADLIQALAAEFPAADPAKIETETCAFLTGLQQKRAVNWK